MSCFSIIIYAVLQYIKLGLPCKTLSGVVRVASDPCPVSCAASKSGKQLRKHMHTLNASAGGKADPATQQNWLCLCFAACRELHASECTASTAQARCESCSKDRTQSKGRFSVPYIQCLALHAHRRRSNSKWCTITLDSSMETKSIILSHDVSCRPLKLLVVGLDPKWFQCTTCADCLALPPHHLLRFCSLD